MKVKQEVAGMLEHEKHAEERSIEKLGPGIVAKVPCPTPYGHRAS